MGKAVDDDGTGVGNGADIEFDVIVTPRETDVMLFVIGK